MAEGTRCPKCGYVRKNDEVVPEWQCPACQVVYTKAQPEPEPAFSAGDRLAAADCRMTRPQEMKPHIKKYIFLLLLIGVAAFFFWPVGKDSEICKSRRSLINRVILVGKSSDKCREELELKKAQVEAYEKAIAQVDADFERMNAEIPVCPITGKKSELNITEDPRPELRAKIQVLQEEIKVLESKVGS